ncbi:PREDICTED: ral GTPase-activating protein subunit alpha-1-like, partial [Acropora digitifera]|uniref:ral GTPase-activating protein subunit alpha-1-like n=1 Tax=Acropora digitifera TaxID=70779 RepID=UPI00077AB53C
MFHNRRAHADIKKTTQKFLDHKKESQARLRALRTLLDVFDASDSRIFFKSHYSEIFYIFHDVFSIVETNLKTRGHRSQREDLDSVLFILEKILLFLPDLLHKRWQFNSIGRIMRKLLHHGNALKLRREGVRLFMLWFQALQENSDEFCQLIFACLVPGFPNPVNNVEWTGRSELTREAAEAIFLTMNDVGPIFPWNTAERNPPQDALTKFFLDRVLDCMSTQLVGIGWMDKENRERAFFFLFENFRKFYLPHIFQDFNPSKTLYDSSPAALAPRAKPNVKDMESDQRMISARESVLRWFVAFTVRFKRTYAVPMSPNVNQSVVSISSTDSSEPGSPGASDAVGVSPERNRETLLDASEVIRKVLYSTRSNVRLLHEVFRQGFLLPAKNVSTIRQVLFAYHEWIKVDLCKRVIHLYRSVVLEVPMDPVTWEQLLEALLEASRHLLVPEMAHNKALSVAKEIAGSLLQTLFVTWIRANLTVKVPITLWNKCLEVISSATHWPEIIMEWKVTIETLTRVMARTVYGLDMGDLPLERLTEQKQKRKRRPQVTQERAAFTKASFTRWSRMERANAPKQLTLYSNGDK